MPWISDLPTGLQLTPNSSSVRVAVTGDTLYACGFNHVGHYTGPLAVIDAVDASVRADWPLIEGSVYCLASDGAGGWFIGGELYFVGGQPRVGVAHIASDGAVSAFAPQVVGGRVRALVRDGTTLYLGGAFESVNGAPRKRLAAIDIQTGGVLPWSPTSGADWSAQDQVHALALDGDNAFISGRFDRPLGGATRKNLGAVSASTGVALAWNPQPDGDVTSLATGGGYLVAGGFFTSVFGQVRRSLACFDATTLSLQPLSVTSTGGFQTVSIFGSTLYACGYVTLVNNVPRLGGAAFSLPDGALLAWNPRTRREDNQTGSIERVVATNDGVFIGGDFYYVGTTRRRSTAALDLVNGAALPWSADLSGNGAHVFALGEDGNAVAVGGDFDTAGGARRTGVAAWNLQDGSLLPFAVEIRGFTGFDSGPIAIAVAGERLYLAGQFRSINGVVRSHLAAVNRHTGELDLSFQPPTTFHPSSDFINQLAIGGGRLYASGSFNLANQTMRNLAAFDAQSGAPLSSFSCLASSISELALSKNATRLYVGGGFTEIGLPPVGVKRLANLDAITGAVANWDPLIDNHSISGVELAGTTLLVHGTFNSIAGQPIQNLARIDMTTAVAAPWQFPPTLNGAGTGGLSSTARFGLSVFFTGSFFGVNNQTRSGLAAINSRTGALLDWAPNPNRDPTSVVVLGQRLFVIGGFELISGQRQPRIAIYGLSSAPPN